MVMMVRRRRVTVNRPVVPTKFGNLTKTGSSQQGHVGQVAAHQLFDGADATLETDHWPATSDSGLPHRAGSRHSVKGFFSKGNLTGTFIPSSPSLSIQQVTWC